MLRPATLLHVLLSLALILNGIGAAEASTRMLVVHAGWTPSMQKAAGEQPRQPPPCSEHAGMAASDAGADPGVVAKSPVETKQSPDCCKSNVCACDCAPQSQVAIAAGFSPVPGIAQATSVSAVNSAHAAAAIPHLIRPPIG